MKPDTLARRLGTTAHLSPLLMKARRLGLRVPEDLEQMAVLRGCRYYAGMGDATVVREESSTTKGAVLDAPLLSNEELAVALLAMSLPYSQHRLRIGAAMLAAEGNVPSRLARLARLESCEAVMRHIALCGRKVEPENVFWDELLRLLPELPMPEADTLPHLTRFVAMTGYTRRGRETIMQWIRPTRPAAA
ncbi:MAG: hypothetical protein Q8M07_14650 [Prosthecobacter sp.]|nr:hypothetical protein [Prosthecobacter sp.]